MHMHMHMHMYMHMWMYMYMHMHMHMYMHMWMYMYTSWRHRRDVATESLLPCAGKDVIHVHVFIRAIFRCMTIYRLRSSPRPTYDPLATKPQPTRILHPRTVSGHVRFHRAVVRVGGCTEWWDVPAAPFAPLASPFQRPRGPPWPRTLIRYSGVFSSSFIQAEGCTLKQRLIARLHLASSERHQLAALSRFDLRNGALWYPV